MRAAQRQAPGRESTLAQFVPQLLVFIIHVRSPPRALPGWDLFFGPQGRVRAWGLPGLHQSGRPPRASW
jgi:hypothetical protein